MLFWVLREAIEMMFSSSRTRRENLDDGFSTSNRNPFDDVSCYASPASIVEAGGSQVGMANEVLDVGKRDALAKEIRDGRDPVMLSTT